VPDIGGAELSVEALQEPLIAAAQLARVNEAAFPDLGSTVGVVL